MCQSNFYLCHHMTFSPCLHVFTWSSFIRIIIVLELSMLSRMASFYLISSAILFPWHHLVGPWLSSLHLVIWGGTLSYLVLVIDRGRLLIHTPWPHLKTSCPWFFVQDALYYQCSLLLWLPWNGWRLYNSAWWTYQDTTLEYTFTAFCWEAAGCFQVPPRDMRYKSSLWSSLSIYLEFHYPY